MKIANAIEADGARLPTSRSGSRRQQQNNAPSGKAGATGPNVAEAATITSTASLAVLSSVEGEEGASSTALPSKKRSPNQSIDGGAGATTTASTEVTQETTESLTVISSKQRSLTQFINAIMVESTATTIATVANTTIARKSSSSMADPSSLKPSVK